MGAVAEPPAAKRVVPTFRHAYRSDRLPSGNYAIRDVPVFAAPKDEAKGKKYTLQWLRDACTRAAERKSGGHLAPVHIEHHDAGATRENAGFMDNYRVLRTTLDGEAVPAVFVDLVEVPPEAFAQIKSFRLPYRSVEILDPEIPELSSLALMASDVPFFRLPMTVVSDPAPTRFCFRAEPKRPRSRRVTATAMPQTQAPAQFGDAKPPAPSPAAAIVSGPNRTTPDGAKDGELKGTFEDGDGESLSDGDAGDASPSGKQGGEAIEDFDDAGDGGGEYDDRDEDDDLVALEAFIRSRRIAKRHAAGQPPRAPAAPAAPAAAPAAVPRVPYRASEDKVIAYVARLQAEVDEVKRQMRAKSDGERVAAALTKLRADRVVHSAEQFKAAVKEMGLKGRQIDAFAKCFAESAAKAPPRPGEGPGGTPIAGGRSTANPKDWLAAEEDLKEFVGERDYRLLASAAGHARFYDATPHLHDGFTRQDYVRAMVSNDRKTLGIRTK